MINAGVVKMKSKIIYRGVCTLLILVSLSSVADDNWINREAQMQCGIANINVTAECKTDPEDKDSNICKNFELKISQKNKIFSTKIPYMPLEQRNKLEKQKFTFPEVIDSTEWAPQKMICIDDKYILIGYWNGMNDAESIDGSLIENVSAPIFDFNGAFVSKEDAQELRRKTPSSPNGTAYINFVYGND